MKLFNVFQDRDGHKTVESHQRVARGRGGGIEVSGHAEDYSLGSKSLEPKLLKLYNIFRIEILSRRDRHKCFRQLSHTVESAEAMANAVVAAVIRLKSRAGAQDCAGSILSRLMLSVMVSSPALFSFTTAM